VTQQPVLRIGTRGSQLARTQAESVARALTRQGQHVELEIVETGGDRRADEPFSAIGSGAFVMELERALVERRVDVAVHSYKDLPSGGEPALTVAAVPAREDAADVLLLRPEAHDPSAGLLHVKEGSVIGTSSTRREALVHRLRPDLRVEPLRGNVPTRVSRLERGDFDAVILASAGLIRLDRAARRDGEPRVARDGLVERRLDPEEFVPAPSQGALAVQVLADRHDVVRVVAAIDEHATREPVSAERALLEIVEGDCRIPFGAFCRRVVAPTSTLGQVQSCLEMHAFIVRDGEFRSAWARAADPLRLARRIAEQLCIEAGDA